MVLKYINYIYTHKKKWACLGTYIYIYYVCIDEIKERVFKLSLLEKDIMCLFSFPVLMLG